MISEANKPGITLYRIMSRRQSGEFSSSYIEKFVVRTCNDVQNLSCYRLLLDTDAILNKIPKGKHKETLSSGQKGQ